MTAYKIVYWKGKVALLLGLPHLQLGRTRILRQNFRSNGRRVATVVHSMS
jgi:hypothetical protein